MGAYPHLTTLAAEKLELSAAERIEHIRKPRWIGYSRAQVVLNRLEDLLRYPKQPRMPNMLLAGETNNGKTVLLNRFREIHPARKNVGGDAVIVPVLYVQAPPGPDERGLYNAILERLFERTRTAESTDQKRGRVINILQRVDLGIIVIDEIHHLLAGSMLKQRNFLNVLKYLGNELCVPIVGAGTIDALRAVQIDPQLQNRFVPELLPRWELNADFARLLASFEATLPLKHPSALAGQAMASRLLALSGGTIGELSKLLEEAAITAIRSGTERIDEQALSACNYTSPSTRRTIIGRI